jgi:hypothetical protein
MRSRLLRNGFPRIQMFILVALTGLAGFGASVAMLSAGMDTMASRYMLAMGVAYIVFLLLLWLWLRSSASDYLDESVLDVLDAGVGGAETSSGGVAAAGDLDADAGAMGSIVDSPFGVLGDADEGAIPLAVVLLALGIALSSLFVIWSAPILFAEILVDALLAAGLYRRLRVLHPRHWMHAAVKRTLLPFILTTLVVGAAGWGMQLYAPEARSLGDVLASR